MSFSTTLVRVMFKNGDDKRDAGLTTPPDIKRFDDISYGSEKLQALDVYRPKAAEGKLPVIVSLHGGGWTYGDKERYQWYTMNLAQRGFAVVNYSYRLAPEYKFPASIEDTCIVFQWVLDNAEKYGFDTERIFAVGDSAGGSMVIQFCCICTNPEYAAKYPVTPPVYPDGRRFIPAAIAVNCGACEMSMDRKKANGLNRSLMKALLPGGGTPEEMDLMNPVKYINGAFPRTFVMTANADDLLAPPAQKVLVDRLEALGIEYVDRTYGTAEEPLNHVFHCNIKTEAARICNDDECAFFLNR